LELRWTLDHRLVVRAAGQRNLLLRQLGSILRQFVIAQFVCAALGGIATLLIVYFVRRAFGGNKIVVPPT
jgi:hypothetical protein